jgi:Tfp pilus assembly PilM family ATPase
MSDPITARLDALNVDEPANVTLARTRLERHQRDLHDFLARGLDQRIIDAQRYAVQRAHDELEAAWHDAARCVAR